MVVELLPSAVTEQTAGDKLVMSTTSPDEEYACTVLLLFTKPNENGKMLTCWLMGCTSMRTSSSAGA